MLIPTSPLLAQAAAPSPFTGMLPLILMIAVFYLLVIRPQTKLEKQRKQRVSKIGRGDIVVLEGGIIGRVSNPDAGGGLAIVEIGDRTKVKVIKEKIYDTRDPEAGKAKEAKDKDEKGKDKDKASAKEARAS